MVNLLIISFRLVAIKALRIRRLIVCPLAAALLLGATAEEPPARLRTAGTAFRTGSGAFEWRGLSAFRLVEMVAGKREQEAIALLDWARRHGLTVVRVFAMARHLFPLTPADGRAALPRLLALAAERGLYVEIVALADTAAIRPDFEAHVRAVGAIAARYPNALVEIANEPGHASQDARLHDPSFAEQLAKLVPDAVPVALGSAEYDPRYARGDYATFHFQRGDDAGGWGHVLELARGAALVERWRKPLVSDEPIGAGTAFEPGRRDDDPRRFRAAAALTRLAGLQATFHYEGGLQARAPAGQERACFDAWRDGLDMLRDVPAGGQFAETPPGTLATVEGARAVFARDAGDEVWLVAVDPQNLSVRWGTRWRERRRLMRDGVAVLQATVAPVSQPVR